jgi:hypothetical protein
MNPIYSFFSDFADSTRNVGQVLGYTWFIFFPPIFYQLFKILWMDFVQIKYLKSLEYVMLEVIPPREIEKSPKLMESFFAGFAGVNKAVTVEEKYLDGVLPVRLSIELVSDGGKVHFYLRTQKGFRNLIEANLFAQYPTAEIVEVQDYVDDVPKSIPNRDWDLWGVDFELVKADSYPIKTYRYFEEDVTGKMIDPLSAVLEVMGKLPPDQKIWLQLVIFPQPEVDSFKAGKEAVEIFKGKKKPKSLGESMLSDIADIFHNISNVINGRELEFSHEEKKDDQPIEFKLTPGEKDVLKALEENVGKNAFFVKMRFLYLGRKANFDKSFVSAFVGAIKQFNDNNLNSFKPNDISKTYANYVIKKSRLRYRQRKIFQRYIDRDPTGKIFTLSTSELATMFHLPDMSVVAPSISRVESKRGGAPTNLPIE